MPVIQGGGITYDKGAGVRENLASLTQALQFAQTNKYNQGILALQTSQKAMELLNDEIKRSGMPASVFMSKGLGNDYLDTAFNGLSVASGRSFTGDEARALTNKLVGTAYDWDNIPGGDKLTYLSSLYGSTVPVGGERPTAVAGEPAVYPQAQAPAQPETQPAKPAQVLPAIPSKGTGGTQATPATGNTLGAAQSSWGPNDVDDGKGLTGGGLGPQGAPAQAYPPMTGIYGPVGSAGQQSGAPAGPGGAPGQGTVQVPQGDLAQLAQLAKIGAAVIQAQGQGQGQTQTPTGQMGSPEWRGVAGRKDVPQYTGSPEGPGVYAPDTSPMFGGQYGANQQADQQQVDALLGAKAPPGSTTIDNRSQGVGSPVGMVGQQAGGPTVPGTPIVGPVGIVTEAGTNVPTTTGAVAALEDPLLAQYSVSRIRKWAADRNINLSGLTDQQILDRYYKMWSQDFEWENSQSKAPGALLAKAQGMGLRTAEAGVGTGGTKSAPADDSQFVDSLAFGQQNAEWIKTNFPVVYQTYKEKGFQEANKLWNQIKIQNGISTLPSGGFVVTKPKTGEIKRLDEKGAAGGLKMENTVKEINDALLALKTPAKDVKGAAGLQKAAQTVAKTVAATSVDKLFYGDSPSVKDVPVPGPNWLEKNAPKIVKVMDDFRSVLGEPTTSFKNTSLSYRAGKEAGSFLNAVWNKMDAQGRAEYVQALMDRAKSSDVTESYFRYGKDVAQNKLMEMQYKAQMDAASAEYATAQAKVMGSMIEGNIKVISDTLNSAADFIGTISTAAKNGNFKTLDAFFQANKPAWAIFNSYQKFFDGLNKNSGLGTTFDKLFLTESKGFLGFPKTSLSWEQPEAKAPALDPEVGKLASQYGLQ